MLKFGAITIDTSHPKSFCKKLEEGDRGRYVAVFNDGFRGEDETNAFAGFCPMLLPLSSGTSPYSLTSLS